MRILKSICHDFLFKLFLGFHVNDAETFPFLNSKPSGCGSVVWSIESSHGFISNTFLQHHFHFEKGKNI